MQRGFSPEPGHVMLVEPPTVAVSWLSTLPILCPLSRLLFRSLPEGTREKLSELLREAQDASPDQRAALLAQVRGSSETG